ncbi:hypothetical protein [Streptomyces sp. BPTC-684]|uniref:hypothetical protein n=1 Tax=Streptomyces sp. BPTC-684 TaxID=3043734 RepID=UPI0024B245C6|nr:hypothetical protein [Streptomyces sp. BPTC-684]WHM37887.1 hypothetical protein QIY60_13865 [Streptomyces sp. BPTC-684]
MSVLAIRVVRTTAAAFLAVGALSLAHSATADTTTESRRAVAADPVTPPLHLVLDPTSRPGDNKHPVDVTWGH